MSFVPSVGQGASFPERDAGPVGLGKPFATVLLIGAQVFAWLVVRRYLLGGNDWAELALRPGPIDPEGLVVSPFVHVEPAHLGVNLLVLWLFGSNLERAIGTIRFTLLYLGAGCFSSLMHWAVVAVFHVAGGPGNQSAALGSSGAVAGVLGAVFVRFPQARLRLPLFARLTFPTTPILVLWLVYTLFRAFATTVTGIQEGVGHWAHFAGFIFGLTGAQIAGLHRVAREEFLHHSAAAATAEGNLPAAAQAWSALLAIRPQSLRVRTALVTTCLALRDLAGARRLAREGIEASVRAGDPARSVEAYLALMLVVPGLKLSPGTRFRVGCWLAEARKDEPAFRALLESIREDGTPGAAASALFRAGQVALDGLGRPDSAREVWQRLIDYYPDSTWAEPARERVARLSKPA
jgi:membrane associated rhomboid family serine protease